MSVAPSLVASCNFAGLVSTAITRPAPAICAPLIAAMPTPPQPITTTVSPGGDRLRRGRPGRAQPPADRPHRLPAHHPPLSPGDLGGVPHNAITAADAAAAPPPPRSRRGVIGCGGAGMAALNGAQIATTVSPITTTVSPGATLAVFTTAP